MIDHRRHVEWRRRFLGVLHPDDNVMLTVVHVSHRQPGKASSERGGLYTVGLYHPVHFDLHTALLRASRDVQKAVGYRECPNGRWITVHPNGDEEDGRPVYICPNEDGTYTVTGGAGGALNGLRLTGVKSESEYKEEAARRKQEAKRAAKLREEALRNQLGEDEYLRRQEEIEAQKREAAAAARAAQKKAIATVAQAMGVDPRSFEVPEEALEGLDAKTAHRVTERAHETAWNWARTVAANAKSVLRADYEAVAQDNTGVVGVEDIAETPPGASRLGYQAGYKQLAEQHGVTPLSRRAATTDVAWKRYLEQSNLDVSQAARREAAARTMVAGRRASRAEVKVAEAKLKEQGLGAEAIRDLNVKPDVQTVQDAVGLVAAVKQAEVASIASENYAREIKKIDKAGEIPKAAVVVARPITNDEAISMVAHDLAEESRHEAVTSLVEKSNEMGDVASLRKHYSVGQTVAFNEAAAAVSLNASIDPLVVDVLGSSGAAMVVAARMRASMSPDDLATAQERLRDDHIERQIDIATAGVANADALMNEADSIVVPEATDPDSVEAALSALAKKADLVARAKESAGVARGRLEAAAAVNWALMQGADKDAIVSLGRISTADALDRAAAIGLTDRDIYDKATNIKVHDGEFDIQSDGQNRILVVHHTGLSRIAGSVDNEKQQRAQAAARIKSGSDDETGWLPEGITRRPVVRIDVDALENRKVDDALRISNNDTQEQIEEKLKDHIGARINAGHDPLSIQSDLWSVSFRAGLGIDEDTDARYEAALARVAPFKTASRGKVTRERADEMEAHVARLSEMMAGYADGYVEKQKAAGKLSADAAALDKQRIQVDEVSRDSLYQAVMSDPRLAYASHGLSELGDAGRAAVRSYALEHVFHVDPNDDSPLVPLSSSEMHAFRDWQTFERDHGEPYKAIQAHWKQAAESQGADLFGEMPETPYADVDLSDPASVMAVGRANAKDLGFVPIRDASGEDTFPFLEPGKSWKEVEPGSSEPVVFSGRTENAIVNDLRRRIRAKLREYFVSEIAHEPTIAKDFNPEAVEAGSNRWENYVRDIGGESRAYRSIQEIMVGDVSRRFASVYSQRTGKKLELGERPMRHAQAHAEAMLPAEKRQALRSERLSKLARAGKGRSGKFVAGERTSKVEAAEEEARQGPALIGASERGETIVPTTRATAGRAIEGALRQMMPYVDVSRPVEVAGDVSMSGAAINRQRAIKLVHANKRVAICLGTGQGKTSVGIGAFTGLFAQGKVRRALIVVPSNIVAQFGAEFHKFVDPEMGLRWSADPTASAQERREAYSDQTRHAVVVTPEALRSDVTAAVAEDMNLTPEGARDMLAGMSQDERDEAIQSAMDKRGWSFDFGMLDEGHRLLDRKGKPDAHMARIARSATRHMPYLIYSTADPVKNDASEAHSVLSLLDPDRYNEDTEQAFYRKYMRNTEASLSALKAEMDPYVYSENADLGVKQERQLSLVDLSVEERERYDRISRLARRVRKARSLGSLDIEALKELAPPAFEGAHNPEAVARRLTRGLESVVQQAYRRAVEPAKIRDVISYTDAHRGEPMLVFAHNLDSVAAIAKQLRDRGHRVGTLTGAMSSDAKDRAQRAFSPVGNVEPEFDVLVCSDAAAMGANLQRGYHLYNFDSPDTAMVHEQRIGREARIGQKHVVHVRDVVADVEYDKRRRRRVERKGILRNGLVGSGVDDSGVATDFEREMA